MIEHGLPTSTERGCRATKLVHDFGVQLLGEVARLGTLHGVVHGGIALTRHATGHHIGLLHHDKLAD